MGTCSHPLGPGDFGFPKPAGAVGGPPQTAGKDYGLKIEPGVVTTRTGQRMTYSTPGVIVLLPDGSSVAGGRQSGSSNQIIRNVAAGPGERIPTSPPGATTVFRLNEDGTLERLGLDTEVFGPKQNGRSRFAGAARGALKGLLG